MLRTRTVKERKREQDPQMAKERQEKYKKELSEIDARRKKKMRKTNKAQCRTMSKKEGAKKQEITRGHHGDNGG
jgi:hypothetical protein